MRAEKTIYHTIITIYRTNKLHCIEQQPLLFFISAITYLIVQIFLHYHHFVAQIFLHCKILYSSNT